MQRSNRDEILDAVADSVRALLVRRTTMAEVARRVELSRSTLYTHSLDAGEATTALLTRKLLSLLSATPDDGDGPEIAVRDGRRQLVGSIRGGAPEQIAFTVLRVARSLAIPARIGEAGLGREKVLTELEHVRHRSLSP